MKDILDFFRLLLDTSDWPPRWHCGKWTEFHGWLYICSDLLIWSAYFAIPIIILRYITKKTDIRFTRIYFLFAGFILACGSTHFMDAVMFWYPAYRLSALLRFITAIISWVTVFFLVKILPTAFALKTPMELQVEIDMRKETERQLQQKIAQITQAEKVARYGHFEYNLQTEKIQWSEGMAEVFELDDAKQVTTLQQYMQFIPMMERNTFKASLHSLENEDYTPRYQNIITAKGNKRVLHLYGKKMLDENQSEQVVLGIAQDVTKMLQNKQKLEYNRKLFEAAFDYSSTGIVLIKFDGKCLDINTVACDILRYSKNEMMRLDFSMLIHPDEKATSEINDQMLLAKEEEYHRSEKRLIRKDGNTIWTLFSKSVVWQENSEDSFFIIQFVDISKRKLLYDEIELKNNRLENLNRSLQHHISQASEFNSIIGHNLKGPAASLIQIAEYINTAKDEDERNFMLTKVKDVAENIMQTLEDMKEFIEVRLTEEQNSKCCFIDLINDCLKTLELQIQKSEAEIFLSIECDYVYFPILYMKSILFNLLSNALKYKTPGIKPKISIHTYEDSNNNICLEVCDNGIGINLQKYKKDIFKYRRIFHKGYDSYGLGLFLTKTQLEAFDGSIDVESEPTQGSKFKIHFKKK